MTKTVALLGDSILGNGAYVAGGTPILEQLRTKLSKEWQAVLLARDGAVVTNVFKQLQSLPKEVSHLVISAIRIYTILNTSKSRESSVRVGSQSVTCRSPIFATLCETVGVVS